MAIEFLLNLFQKALAAGEMVLLHLNLTIRVNIINYDVKINF